MKPLLIAAALLLLPAGAQAQVAAASMPNSFDSPVRVAQTAPPAAVSAAPAPAHPRAEAVLRDIIAGAQAGTIDYALMSDDLAARVREQEATIQPLIAGFGLVQAVDFVGSQNGADLFAVIFANAATDWVIGFNEAGKVAALLFRPAA
jgi:hypothetical protein